VTESYGCGNGEDGCQCIAAPFGRVQSNHVRNSPHHLHAGPCTSITRIRVDINGDLFQSGSRICSVDEDVVLGGKPKADLKVQWKVPLSGSSVGSTGGRPTGELG
jgi:hypothetical protein